MTQDERLERIENLLTKLIEREQVREWYSTEQAAQLLGKAEFTVREWCRLGRLKAEKRMSGRGKHPAWVISHDEMRRWQREGLLPFRRPA
jgi:transposase